MPPCIIALWDEVEAFAGVQISAQCRPGETAACNPDEFQATLFLPDMAAVSQSDVVHELLHIRRYWVDMAPQIAARPGEPRENWQIGCSIDNMIEHIFVIPATSRYTDQIDPQRQRDVDQFATTPLGTEYNKKFNCLAYALGLENGYYSQDQGKTIKYRLREEGMMLTRPLARKVTKMARHDKLNAGRIIREYLDIPRGGLISQTFDIKNKTKILSVL